METLINCPLCSNNSFQDFLQTIDFFLSRETFSIVVCQRCGLRFTNPRPGKDEMAKYYESNEYISHHANDQGLFSCIYRSVRHFTIRNKYRLVSAETAGRELLDIGCGTGEFLKYCTLKGFKAQGIEPDEHARKYAAEILKLDVFPEDYFHQIKPASHDVITLWHVLEHVHELEVRMKTLKEILKPGGILVMAVPNSDSWDAAYYGKYWAAYDLPRHLYHFTPFTLGALAEKFFFKVSKIIPMKFDAFYISLLSEKYMTGNKKYLQSLRNGIRSNIFGKNNNNNFSSFIMVLKNDQDAK